MKRVKKTTLDCAMDWVRDHGYDFYDQFTAREWELAKLVCELMDPPWGYNEEPLKYRAAVKKAYEILEN